MTTDVLWRWVALIVLRAAAPRPLPALQSERRTVHISKKGRISATLEFTGDQQKATISGVLHVRRHRGVRRRDGLRQARGDDGDRRVHRLVRPQDGPFQSAPFPHPGD